MAYIRGSHPIPAGVLEPVNIEGYPLSVQGPREWRGHTKVTANGQVIQSTNNLAGGAATFNLTVPAGVGTVQATASFTLP